MFPFRISKIIRQIINKRRFSGASLNNVIIGPEFNKRFEIRHAKNLSIGYKTVLNGDCFINALGGVTIGHHCHFAKGLTIYSHNHNWKSEVSIPYDNKNILKPVVIGDAVWIGANVTILPGSVIENGAIISAGSVVCGRIPRCAIVRGNPAIVISYRDKVIFDKLESEGNFL